MSRYDEKCNYDARQERIAEEVERRKWAKRDFCDRDCPEHNEFCPYYDAEQESFDYEQCFEDKGE